MKEKKLVIVESPAKAKTIGQYLGSGYTVRASYGHVRDLPSSKLSIDTEHDYKVEYATIPKAKKVLAALKGDLKESSGLILATDLDREGEAIAWHLVEALKPKQPVERITFHEITKAAIEKALDKPRQISQTLVDAQQARRILDRLVGYKLSPLLWKKVYRGLSAGRVQSVAVRLIVEREREIQAFKTREYWTLEAKLEGKKGSFNAYLAPADSTTRLELDKKDELEKLAKSLKSASLKVDGLEESLTKLKSQPPLITSTLQQLAARLHSFSAKRTMKLAQDLYEGVEISGQGTVALITYMRTDSQQMSDSAISQARGQVNKEFGQKYLPTQPNQFTKKVRGAQEAHEAIRPTNFSFSPAEANQKISRDHAKLYSLIYRTAIASQMVEATVENTVASIKAGDKYHFIGRGRKLKFDGFLKVYPDSEERFEALPELARGESLKLKSIEPIQHFTEPPARYSEASLVKELEKRGIGRPSTYAPIMSTIVDRGYVTKQAGRFIPEAVADVVTSLLVDNFASIVDYNFTAKMEEELDDIAEGEKKLIPVIDAFYKPFAKLLSEKEKTIDKKELVEQATDKICPKCGKPLVIKLGRNGQFYACTGYPDCNHTEPLVEKQYDEHEQAIIETETKDPCPKCKGQLEVKQSRFGMFIGCSNYPKCKFTKPITIPAEVKCPNCGKDINRKTTRRGKIFWGCSGYPKCKTAFWDEPINQKCPECANLMVKKNNGSLVCSQCKHEEEAKVAA